jgi:DNA-directed RNA polymerase subunit K/omega
VSEELVQPETPPEPPAADERNVVLPMQQRFLFVDIAAQRAKQLRRGAVTRLLAGNPEPAEVHLPHKAERIAMEEVRRGFIPYDLPENKPPQSKPEGTA